MKIRIESYEQWNGSEEYDNDLRGLCFEPSDEIERLCKEKQIILDDLLEWILGESIDVVEYSNRKVEVFYNQTVREYNVRVQFDYKGELDLKKFNTRLDGFIVIFDGDVDRNSSSFKDASLLQTVQNNITMLRTKSNSKQSFINELNKLVSDEVDSILIGDVEELKYQIKKIDFTCYDYKMKELIPSSYKTVAQDIRELLWIVESHYFLFNKLYSLTEELEERERIDR